MKKMVMKAGLFIGAAVMLTSCNEPIVWDDSVGLVGFSTTMVTLAEGETASLGVFYSAPAGAETNEINLAVSTEGIAVPASEGTDFTLSAKTLNMEVGTKTISITATDDDGYTGNKSFYIAFVSNSANCPSAVPSAVKVIILEDEHPLTAWVGTYTVTAVSYYAPGDADESWTVTTDIVPSDPTKLQIRGIAAEGSGPVIATLNTETMTIEMASDQSLGTPYPEGTGYGEISIYYATDDLVANSGLFVTQEMLNEAKTHNISGTLQADGTILIDLFAEIDDGSLISWDTFNTTWVKQ